MADPLANTTAIVSATPAAAAWVARPAPPTRVSRAVTPVVRARYDAAQYSDENRRHWANVDGLSARAANSADVRYRLRTRARYESANNSYARGIVLTLANDTIGTGPRLQLLTDDNEVNRAVEKAFMRWSDVIGLADKLRVMRQSRAVDGEAFALLTSNDRLDSEVQLDIKIIEADQVTTPDLVPSDINAIDGIRFDGQGNPIEYHVLRTHPGDIYPLLWAYDRIPARSVIHWFRADRPGQARGIPDITPALPLFAQLRRYTLAVLAAAETAADFAAVLYSDMPPNGEADPAEPFESLEITPRMMTTLPSGWKMGQFEAAQPTTTYAQFKAEILNEIARCLNMPFNVAAGNSSGYNYSSGRLDHQVYYKSLRVDQSQAELVVLDRIFAAWLDEFSLVSDVLPAGPAQLGGWPHQWFWDGQEHVDPQKEAIAQETRLRNHTTTLADEYARRGQDWEVQIRQRAKELELMTELGLSVSTAPTAAMQPVTPEPDDGGSNADTEDA